MTGSHTADELETMAAALEASGQYRVLRKLNSRAQLQPADGSPTRVGLFVDDPAFFLFLEARSLVFRVVELGVGVAKLHIGQHRLKALNQIWSRSM